MKNLKRNILFLVILVILLNPLVVFANDTVSNMVSTSIQPQTLAEEELDPHGYIQMPMIIINGSGTISVSSELEGEYQLYYQWIELSDEEFALLKAESNEAAKFFEESKQELADLESELDILEEAYETENAINPDSEETKLAYEAYSTALDNYNNTVDEINAKIAEYNTNIEELTPKYVEDNWNATEEGKVQIDLTNFDTMKSFILWAKLTTTDGTYYAKQMYSLDGQKEEDTNQNEDNNNQDIPNNNNQDKQDSTVSDKITLPKAGKNIITTVVAILFVIVILVGYVSYRKYKNIKNI